MILEDDPKNEDDLKNQNDVKYEDNLKLKTTLETKMILKRETTKSNNPSLFAVGSASKDFFCWFCFCFAMTAMKNPSI